MTPIVVQKYGGTSVATPEKIRAVAERVVSTAEKGYKVVVVVSAMGKTTDELLDLAKRVDPDPSERELDMLLATGEQVSIALILNTADRILHTVVKAQDIGIIKHAAHHRLQAGNANRFTHIGNVKPHVVALAQGGPSLFAGRLQEQGHCGGRSFFYRVENKLFFAAVRFHVDQLPVHLIGLGLHVFIDTAQDIVGVKGKRCPCNR